MRRLSAEEPSPALPDETADGDVGGFVARLTEAGEVDRRDRSRALAGLARAMAGSARAAGTVSVLGGRWLVDLLIDIAPRIAVRDLAALRAAHPGLDDEALGAALTSAAARVTSAVGAAGGALAAVEFVAPPALLTAPVQLAAETLAVAAVEVKLIAELHEVYGVSVVGTASQRAAAYLNAWANRRGVDPMTPGSFTNALGGAAKRQLRRRMAGRVGRNLSTMGPLLTGAVAGGVVNSRETRRLGEDVRRDLRSRRR